MFSNERLKVVVNGAVSSRCSRNSTSMVALVSIGSATTTTEQGGTQNIGVTMTITGTGTGTCALGMGVTVTVDVVDLATGTAVSGTDYDAFGTKTVTFNNGATTGTVKNVSIEPRNDRLLEGNETVQLRLQNLVSTSPGFVSVGNLNDTVTISDDESATLAIGTTNTVTEAGGVQSVGVVTLTITGTGTGTFGTVVVGALGTGTSTGPSPSGATVVDGRDASGAVTTRRSTGAGRARAATSPTITSSEAAQRPTRNRRFTTRRIVR